MFSYKLDRNWENGLVVSPVIGHRRLLCSKEGAESYAGEGICISIPTGREQAPFQGLTNKALKHPRQNLHVTKFDLLGVLSSGRLRKRYHEI